MAMITSSEIKNAAFEHTTFRGYNPEQVDRILDNAAETVDSLTRENAILNEKLHALTTQIETYREREGSVNEIMIRAQKMSDDMVAEAKVKSDAMIADAQRKSDELLNSAKSLGESKIAEYKDSIRLEKEKLTDAREEAAGFIDMICGELMTHAELIAKIKTRAHLEDVEARPVAPIAPAAPVVKEAAPAPAPAEVQEPAKVEEPAPAAPEAPAEPVIEIKVEEPAPAPAPVETPKEEPSQIAFDFASAFNITKEAAAEPAPAPAPAMPAAPAEAPAAAKVTMADDIANSIFGNPAPAPAPAPTAGMSWDEIIGLKSSPASAKRETVSSDTSVLKFGKEFDITIK